MVENYTVLWQGTSAWKDEDGKQRRCPARIIQIGFVLSLEFADMPQYPDMWANYEEKLRKPEPPVPAELLVRLEAEVYGYED